MHSIALAILIALATLGVCVRECVCLYVFVCVRKWRPVCVPVHSPDGVSHMSVWLCLQSPHPHTYRLTHILRPHPAEPEPKGYQDYRIYIYIYILTI